MRPKLLYLLNLLTILFASGGYDNGTSAGKGRWDISLTLNPFNYFNHGQSYAVIGYGVTEKFDIHMYYSKAQQGNDNYYGGLFYQFYQSKKLNLSTAIGVRKYTNEKTTHLFVPQLLYTLQLNEKVSVGGSFVEIRNQSLINKLGMSHDLFFTFKLFDFS